MGLNQRALGFGGLEKWVGGQRTSSIIGTLSRKIRVCGPAKLTAQGQRGEGGFGRWSRRPKLPRGAYDAGAQTIAYCCVSTSSCGWIRCAFLMTSRVFVDRGACGGGDALMGGGARRGVETGVGRGGPG